MLHYDVWKMHLILMPDPSPYSFVLIDSLPCSTVRDLTHHNLCPEHKRSVTEQRGEVARPTITSQ